MKEFCEKHALKEFKHRANQIHLMGRVLPSQELNSDQKKCKVVGCHNRVTWIIQYISDMNIRIIKKEDKNANKN